MMPESTDFEEWARQVHAAIVLLQRDPDLADMSERVARAGIEELLKRIWNARGAADLAAKHAAFRVDVGLGGALADLEDEAIRKLDR